MNKITDLPILPLRSMVIFPNTSTAIDVSRDFSIAAISHSVNNKTRIVAVMQNSPDDDKIGAKQIKAVGTLCDVSKVVRVDENLTRVYLDGISLVDIGDVKEEGLFLVADVYERLHLPAIGESDLLAFKTYILKTCKSLERECQRHYPSYVKKGIEECQNAELLANLASAFLSGIEGKYDMLISNSPRIRLEMTCEMMGKELDYGRKVAEIEEKVQEKLTRNNKEFILREQMKVINDELNNDDEDHINEYKAKIEAMIATDEVKTKLIKEADRLSRMNESAPESSIIRNYLDTILSLPWGKMTEDKCDLKEVREVLDADHYGIDEVKDRIVEYLAVRQLATNKAKGTAICLSGPPGVGKTSIAKSIARALGKEYVQLTLGGIHDEAEIRGHRKTYIGAMPGRIITSLTKAKTNNPVFLLDEVDKITKDMRGDPQSALLEVLDPNQNTMFRDNYIEIPYDLSNVMFILTANDLSALDKPLIDRLEIINMDGYTTDEKVAIAEKYLVKKQSGENGIGEERMALNKAVIREIVEGYTNESGVRELDRKIATVARKIAYKMVAEGDKRKKFIVKTAELKKYLGMRRNPMIEHARKGEVGIVTGLAWTSLGGTTLDIEVLTMPGSGVLTITGSLGDVMKESARIALSLAEKYIMDRQVERSILNGYDIHLHVPMGSVPKDGPSAGVTMVTAIYSALTNTKVIDSIAMTGEVSLSGKVHAIGGLKEKALAAHRKGIKKVIIPEDNLQDLEKLPKAVIKDIEFIIAKDIKDVLMNAIEGFDPSCEKVFVVDVAGKKADTAIKPIVKSAFLSIEGSGERV